MKSKVALAVAVALAVLAAVGSKAYLTRMRRENRKTSKTVPVLYAVKNIPKGKKLTTDMVKERYVEANSVQSGRTLFLRDLEKVIGKGMVLEKNVQAGEQLTWSLFITKTASANPSAGLSPGYRRITIPVDKVTGCAGSLLPGTVVDVLVTLRLRGGSANAPIEPVTQTVLTGVLVMAIDLNTRRPYKFTSSKERRSFASYSTVSLRVLPLQASLLAWLTDQGKMHLIIRSPDDPTGRDPTKLDKITLDKLDVLIKKAAEEKPPK